jgi:hypothetical protein
MRRPLPTTLCSAIACILQLVPHASFAQNAQKSPASPAPSSAERLFQEGTALMNESRFVEACAKLAESERLESGIGTLLWLGECLQKSDKQASAYRTFQKAAAVARTRGDNREIVASTRAARIEPSVPRWTLIAPAVGEHAELAVTLDGAPIARDEWGSAAMIDAGDYQLTFTERGYVDAKRPLHIDPAARVMIAMPELTRVEPSIDADPMHVVGGVPDSTPIKSTFTAIPRVSYWSTRRVAGATLAAAGVAAIGIGLGLALGAKGVYDDTALACSGGCVDDASFSRRQDARERAGVATWLVAVGGTAAATGLVVTLWPSAKSATKTGATFTITPTGANARVAF